MLKKMTGTQKEANTKVAKKLQLTIWPSQNSGKTTIHTFTNWSKILGRSNSRIKRFIKYTLMSIWLHFKSK